MPKNETIPTQPEWVCGDCGDEYGHREHGLATWHPDTCGVCGKYTVVTEPRDYGYLRMTWQKHKRDEWCEHRPLKDGTCALCGKAT